MVIEAAGTYPDAGEAGLRHKLVHIADLVWELLGIHRLVFDYAISWTVLRELWLSLPGTECVASALLFAEHTHGL